MYAVCPFATRRLIKIIKHEKPDIVHLHCINGYCVDIYKLLQFLGNSEIKTVVTHHAEFFYTGNCGHAYDCVKFLNENGCYNCHMLKESTSSLWIDRTNDAWKHMKKSFSYFKEENIRFTAVSPWVVARSNLSPICNAFNCCSIYNGLDTNIFRVLPMSEIESVRNKIPHEGKKIIMHVTAFFTTDANNIKGGAYIKRFAEMLPSYIFVVVASRIGAVDDIPSNVYVWGRASSQAQLAALYNAADLTIITSKRETFSMIIAESLCCGTPVVGFEAGGPESIAIKEYSSFVPYGDEANFISEIDRCANLVWNSCVISNIAAAIYSKEEMTRGYINLYEKMIE